MLSSSLTMINVSLRYQFIENKWYLAEKSRSVAWGQIFQQKRLIVTLTLSLNIHTSLLYKHHKKWGWERERERERGRERERREILPDVFVRLLNKMVATVVIIINAFLRQGWLRFIIFIYLYFYSFFLCLF